MYWTRKPEMTATRTFVSTTVRCFRFLGFGGNGDLRQSPLFPLRDLFADGPALIGKLLLKATFV
jgi:hypothetical protein